MCQKLFQARVTVVNKIEKVTVLSGLDSSMKDKLSKLDTYQVLRRIKESKRVREGVSQRETGSQEQPL